MKKLIVSAFAVICLVGLSYVLGTARGQQTGTAPAGPPHKVGLIDMGFVFKNYKKFEALREDLKEEFQQVEEQAKGMAEKIQGIDQELKSGVIKQGSPEFIEREREMVRMTAEFNALRATQQKELLRKESKIYHTVYLEVQDAVNRFCKTYGYTLVVRYDREEVNSADPQKLIQSLQRLVVYSDPNDDLTDSVVDYLNRKFQPKQVKAPAKAGVPANAANPGRTSKN